MDKGEVRVLVDEETGGRKEQSDIRLDLIPAEALWEVGRVYGLGARKYEDNNWRRGYRWSNSYAALQRHAARFWAGEDRDEGGFDHMAAVAWHALTLLTFMREHPELDDRFKKEVK